MERVYLWHPLLVHFTIGLLTTSVALYFAARLFGPPAWRERFHVAARVNLWLGTLVTGLTVGAGMIAYGSAPQGDDAQYTKLVHSWAAYATAALFVALAALAAWKPPAAPARPSWPFLAGLALALIALSVTGYLGGELVFTHGVGVELPHP